MNITKAIIPIAGAGTRFLPLAKVLPKELFPLVDKPVIQYIVEEAMASGIKEIIFVNQPGKKTTLNYFRKNPELEKFLMKKSKNHILEEMKKVEEISEKISFSEVFQKEPLGDGHAVLQAKTAAKQGPCAVLFADDVVDSKTPCLLQLKKVFEKYQKPVLALYRIPKEKIPFYGIAKVEKISGKVYQIKGIVEKPSIKNAPSNLAVVGKYIITPEVFRCLGKDSCMAAGEIRLAGAFEEIIKNGKMVLGCEFEGKWLECGNKQAWLESNIYFSLKHPEYGPKLRKLLTRHQFAN